MGADGGSGSAAGAKAAHGGKTIAMTYVEIYNNQITDLLSPTPNKLCTLVEESGTHRGSSGRGAGFRAKGALEFVAASPEELLSAYKTAATRRATASTKMNDESSRSHALLILKLPCPAGGARCGAASKRRPVINVVDLAGSERVKRSGATGVRMNEAISINSSLLALARVVRALISKQSTTTTTATTAAGTAAATNHIPYRGSVLTKMLASSLGGRARTVLIATVAPTADSKDETISTLRFASIATHVKNDVDKKRAAEAEAAKPLTGTITTRQQQLLLLNAEKCSPTMFDDRGEDHGLMIKLPGSSSSARSSIANAGSAGSAGAAAGSAAAATKKAANSAGSTGALHERAARDDDHDDVECFGDFTAGVDAPCVLFLHYYGHGSEGGAQFVDWFKPLSEAGYRCLAPSFPGHGNTPGKLSGKPDAEILGNAPCTFVTRLLQHFGIRKVAVLVGYDWGGGIAMEYAIRHSARVGAVVGWSISHRDETRMAKLKKRSAKKKSASILFLGQKNSLVHPFIKQQKHAAACGMKAVCVKGEQDAMKVVLAFVKKCGAS